jgi:hypothetical protein
MCRKCTPKRLNSFSIRHCWILRWVCALETAVWKWVPLIRGQSCPHVWSSLCTSSEGAFCSGSSAVVRDALWSANNTFTSWLPPLSLCGGSLTKLSQSVSPYSYSFCYGLRLYFRPLHLFSQRSFYGVPQSINHFLIQKFIQMIM